MATLFASKPTQINLIPEKEFAKTIGGRLLTGVVSSFRIMVILTEIFVMIAFLSRFWLDAQNTDLNEEIEKKKAILLDYQNFERQFRDAQQRIAIYTQYDVYRKPSEFLVPLIDSVSPDIILTNISKSEDFLTIQGRTVDESFIQQFMLNLESKQIFSLINLSDVKSDPTTKNLLEFT